jgi:hypothetical protein
MTAHARLRLLVGLAAIAVLALFMATAQAQAPISVSPSNVQAGTTPTLTISSNGFFDLSQVAASQIDINPRDGVTNLRVSNATARSLTLSFDLASAAAGGDRMLSINALDVTVSMKLAVAAVVPPQPPISVSPRNVQAGDHPHVDHQLRGLLQPFAGERIANSHQPERWGFQHPGQQRNGATLDLIFRPRKHRFRRESKAERQRQRRDFIRDVGCRSPQTSLRPVELPSAKIL